MNLMRIFKNSKNQILNNYVIVKKNESEHV